jgi:transposase
MPISIRPKVSPNIWAITAKEHIYTDSGSVSVWIASTFGVQYTPQGIADMLHRIGFTYKKAREVPCANDEEKQEAFVRELSKILSDMDDSSC